MNFAVSLVGIALLSFSGLTFSRCMEGQTKACSVGGKPGVMECLSGAWTPCEVHAGPARPVSGTLVPDYLVLAVIYAPPGRDAQNGGGSVTYAEGSSFGSSLSSSTSFKLGYKVTLSGEAGGSGLDASFSWGAATGTESTIGFKKSSTRTVRVPGPAKNAVDHGYDQIWLWLKPKVNLHLYPDYAKWGLSADTDSRVTYVRVRELQDPTNNMSAETEQLLRDANITPEKYPQLLALNPFSSGSSAVDAKRYHRWGSVPYKPPPTPRDAPTSISDKFSVENSVATVDSSEVETSVGVAITGGVDFIGLAKSKLKNELAFNFKYTGKIGNSSSSTEEAGFTIDGPTHGYTGPENIIVYYDKLFGTFMFQPTSAAPSFTGRVRSQAGNSVAGKLVTVISSSGRIHSVTDSNGSFALFGAVTGANQLRIDGVRQRLDGQTLRRRVIDVLLP